VATPLADISSEKIYRSGPAAQSSPRFAVRADCRRVIDDPL
jgi:hypothetical protein